MKYILVFLLTMPLFGTAFSQSNTSTYIKGYNSYEHIYFDSLNSLWNTEIANLTTMYEVYVTFRVDTNSKITGVEITDLPVRKMPESLRAYIKKLMESTNGKWIPANKNNHKVISEEMVYRFDVARKNQSMQERLKEGEKILEYYWEGQGIAKEPINKFLQSGGKTIFIKY